MKLIATVAGVDAPVKIRRESDRVFAAVGDSEYQLNVHNTGNGLYLLTLDGQVFDCRVEGLSDGGSELDIFVGADHFRIALTDSRRLRGSTGSTAHADGAARILAPMPGKVVRLLVEPGTRVEAGAGIVVVEAMKMQNEMRAPKAGIVTALNVEVGTTVNGGDVLAVIE